MKMDGEVKNFFEGSDRYLKAKKFAKNKNGKIKPVYEIGALGGKNFKGYQVVYNKNLSKTPAPKKERIYGSKVNKPKSSESKSKASSIILSPSVIKSINTILKEHNSDYPNKKIPLATAKAVVRRGMGAYSSTHRPTIKGGKPNSRVAWGLARLNAFVYKIQKGHSKSGKYSQDNDLINELGYRVSKFDGGGNIESLYKDHHEVWALSEKIIKNVCEENCSKYSDKIYYLYELELKPHFEEEENDFFPKVLNDTNKIAIEDLIKEHKTIADLCKTIRLYKKTSDIKLFCTMIIEHIKKEEAIMQTISADPYKKSFKNGGFIIKAPSEIKKMPSFIAPNGERSNLIGIKAEDENFDKYDSDIRYKYGGNIPKFNIESREGEEDRTTISIKGIGKVVLVETFPEYEFTEDIDENTLNDLGLSEGDMIGKIEHLEIKDEYKGNGYAKLLMKKAIELAKEKGLMPLYLNASPMGSKRYGLNLEDLTNFYESFGFKVFLNQGNNNLMILKEQDVKFNEGGNIQEYKYFLVLKYGKPIFKVKFSQYNKETENDMSEMLDRLSDLGYELKPINEQEYKEFDYSTVNKEDISEFLKNWSFHYKEGGIITDEQKETYKKWKELVNMSSSELKKFLDSDEGKVAGLSKKEADDLGIDYGRESASWILRMKDTPYTEWTPNMWRWAKKQISFISRMTGNKGKLFDENGKRTRKYLSLLVWGNNPLKK